MLGSLVKLRCCDAYLCSSLKTTVSRRPATAGAGRQSVSLCRRVLIVEFRDEVFAHLKQLFESYGCEVARAGTGAEVGVQVKQFAPGLIVVNESMPDESGWLITCKLRLTNHRQRVWLYAARTPRLDADWKEVCGVDQILAYGGVLSRLVLRVRQQFDRGLDASVTRTEPRKDNLASPPWCQLTRL